MQLEISARCDRGLVRARNEDMALVDQELIRDAELNDSLLQLGPDFQFIAAVADGIG